MRRSIDDSRDDHPSSDDERPPASWAVAIADDCDACDDQRVLVTVEEVGRSGAGLVLHLSAETARRLRAAVGDALREMGEPPGP